MPPIEASFNIEHPPWIDEIPEYESIIRLALQQTWDRLSTPNKVCEISILLTHNQAMAKLNQTYRGKDKPTNVLSFPSHKNPLGQPDDIPLMLGDIILAFELIKDQASEQHKTFEQHLSHLVVHGMLHLLGYDHITPTESLEMESLEAEILSALGIENPYTQNKTAGDIHAG